MPGEREPHLDDLITAGDAARLLGTNESTGQSRRFLIVGVGASAGGLEALEQFFSHVSADCGLAFVVIQHLAPQHASMLAQLLGRGTMMEVREVQDGVPAEPNHVYVIAPGTVLGIAGGSFQVKPGDGERHAPINAFFSALAADQREHAVGIVLSGSGTDGTVGLRAIKEHGGLTLAQTPATAKHDNMPKSAIEAGWVDHVLPPDAMPPKLLERARDVAEGRAGAAPSAAAPSDEQLMGCLERIYEILQHATGHDFSHYKRGTVLRRLRRRVQLHRAASTEEYVARLAKDPQEPDLLAKDLLIGVTQFFRDPEAFDYVARHVLPRIFAAKGPGHAIRIWVAGCASGEEAYSLGMLVCERLAKVTSKPLVQIFATDIDGEAIAEARQARYPAEIAQHVSPERLARFFMQEGASYRVTKEVREMCVFSEHSLIRDPPFLGLDLLSCRNVLIYLDADIQKKLVPVFHYALKRDGYLFLGASEGLAGDAELFETVDKQFRVFRRVETLTRPQVSFPLRGRVAPPAIPRPHRARPPAPGEDQAVCSVFERIMLQEYGTPGAVVNAQGDVICIAGQTGRYLQPPTGILSTNILDIAHASLRIDLRTALHAASRSGRKVVRDDVPVEVEGSTRRLRLTVRPLLGNTREDLFIVVLQERASQPEHAEEAGAPLEVGAENESTMEQLESELRTTRADLRATIEELESANEELKSSNEEMLSTNEEMQSSNEELQSSQEELKSVNEELSTVNAELSRKVDELGRANSDLLNLFGSTDIATLFLDRELRVTRATPAAKALFRLIDTDTGRPISDLAPRFTDLDLVAEIEEVLRSLAPVEREVQTLDRQAWFLLRVLPYRTVENVVAGAVVTLADITGVKKAEADLRRLATVVLDSNDAITVQDFEGHILAWNRGAERMYGYSAQEALGMNIEELVPEESSAQARSFLDAISRGDEVASLEVKRRTKDGRTIDVWLTTTKLVDERGSPSAVATTERDISEPKRNLAAVEAMAEQFRRAIEEAPIPVIMHAEDGEVLQISRSWTELTGYTHEDMKSLDAWLNRAYGPGAEVVREHVRARFRGDQREMGVEFPIPTRDGQTRHWSVSASSPGTLYDGRRFIVAMAVDMTDRRRAEEALKESEQDLNRAQAVAHVGSWRLDVRRNELRWSDETYRMFGIAKGMPLTYETFLAAVHPEDRELVDSKWQKAVGGEAYDVVHRIVLGDEVKWVREKAELEHDAKGQLLGGFGTVQDVTEARRLQQALRDANDRLQEADRRKNEFLAMLSHELRNPLAPIRSSLYILDRAAPGGEQARRAQAVIDRQVGQMTRLIDDLLDVTRITRGQFLLQPEHLDLNELVQRTVEDHSSMFARSKVELEAHLAPAEIWVNGDRTRLAQAIGNLLQNAVKFTPPGGRTTVSVETDAEQKQAVVIVRDTGRGITSQIMPRLFETFTQADTSLDRGRGGLGLGLALVKGLIEMHGGSVRAESEGLGRGAAFTLRLPLDASAAAAPMHRRPRGDGAQRRVLIIEDNVDAADSLREALELGNYLVEVAYNGPQGIKEVRVFHPDIVICDIGLPDVDGYEVARRMRADPGLAHVALVALTGYAQPEDVAKAKEAGFDEHLAKPPSIEALQGVLEDIEGRSHGDRPALA